MRTWSSIGFIVGSILLVVGIGLHASSDIGMVPIPAGWIVALFFLVLGSSLMLSSLMLGIEYYTLGFGGLALFLVGVRLLTIYPYLMPECTCPTDQYGTQCKACDCVHGQCDQGYRGTGNCICDLGWAGEKCDRCAPTFEGISCDRCKHPFDGKKCDRCFPGYVGKCDQCAPNFKALEGTFRGQTVLVCEPCSKGWGGYCQEMPDCQKYDKKAVARDAVFWKRLYDPSQCTSTVVCEDRYDCDSFNCRGICVDGDNTYNRCENDMECKKGTCQYKRCCEELKYGDGTCECNTFGYFGPLCEKCPAFDGMSTCNGHGTCTAVYANKKYSHLECVCDEGWSGDECSCRGFGNCTSCADGYWGPTCQKCPGGGGINQCHGHGSCKDNIDGDGSCVCDKSTWQAFGGESCQHCDSGAFQGENCDICPGGEVVGFKTEYKFNDNYIFCP